MKTRFVVILGIGLVGIPSLAVKAEVKVEPDKENVAASRIEGDWQLDAALTKRLTDKEPKEKALAISFKSDPDIAKKIPAKYEKFLAGKKVYMAGVMTLQEAKPKQHPFILTEHRGNPHVVFFRERDGDPLGDAESFNVMLAVAKDKQNDLLFIGGDFNNQPFSAFVRAKVEKK
ncbi:MAG: hypothetical protein L0241_12415 [Planctomycetia bacterium]|nr:hypothetical protein [Planctomycetia bacterium]